MKIDAKKKITVDKIQYPFIIETVSKLGIEGNFLNWIKVIYKKKKGRTLNATYKVEEANLKRLHTV